MQKYHLKSSVRSCESWGELKDLLFECKKKKMISMKSANFLYAELIESDMRSFKEFKSIRGKLSDALNGKKVTR
jgi:hypothetical protein